jgi:hypothetical protein
MHEDVVAILTADKSEALGIVKPFYCSLFHYSCSSYSNVPLNAMLVTLRVERYCRNKQKDQSDSTTRLSIPSERAGRGIYGEEALAPGVPNRYTATTRFSTTSI